MNFDKNMISEMDPIDSAKMRKPAFETFNNGTVKFSSTFFIEVEETTWEGLWDIALYPMELDLLVDLSTNETSDAKDFPILNGKFIDQETMFRKCQFVLNPKLEEKIMNELMGKGVAAKKKDDDDDDDDDFDEDDDEEEDDSEEA